MKVDQFDEPYAVEQSIYYSEAIYENSYVAGPTSL